MKHPSLTEKSWKQSVDKKVYHETYYWFHNIIKYYIGITFQTK